MPPIIDPTAFLAKAALPAAPAPSVGIPGATPDEQLAANIGLLQSRLAQNPNADMAPAYQQGQSVPMQDIGQYGPQQHASIVKRLLNNFFSGMGQTLQLQSGVPQFRLEQQRAQASIPYQQALTQQAQLQNQIRLRQLQMFQQMNAGGVGQLLQPLGQLSPDEQALMSAAQSEAAAKADMTPIFDAIRTVSNWRRMQNMLGGGSNVVIDPATGQPVKQIFTKGGKVGVTVATTPQAQMANTELNWIAKAQGGDKEAQANLAALQKRRTDLAATYGASRAQAAAMYGWQTITDPNTGMIRPAQGWEVQQMLKDGQPITASGRLSAKDQLAVQQLASEAAPAIANVSKDLAAYDNATDRKIFARVIHDAGTPRYGQESSWMGNVLNQALLGGLSKDGQALVRDLTRINETVGRFRTIMGAPSTDTQMALAMALLPGSSTPNSAYAKEQLKNFDDMVRLGVNVPILRGAGGNGASSPAKPSSGKRVVDLTK